MAINPKAEHHRGWARTISRLSKSRSCFRYGLVSNAQLRLYPWWDLLRDDPRFEQIMEKAKEPVALT